MLTGPVLVLNKSYFPVHITDVKRAFCLMYRGLAKAVDEQYQTFDFHSWAELSDALHGDSLQTVDYKITIPRVILLIAYNHMPKREVRFSRLNILIRDAFVCQYCGKCMTKKDLNLDHVIPRSQGGKTSWENIVTSCLRCNHRKGGRTPEQANMKLRRTPYCPNHFPFSTLLSKTAVIEAWRPFLNVVDFSYWNVELEP